MKIGIDIVEIDQVREINDLERFLEKYFDYEEIKYIRRKVKKEQTIAGIYAAKEAFLKALEIGIGVIPLSKVIVAHKKETNAPYIIINKEVREVLHKYGYSKIDVSISHGGNYSVAICDLS